MTRDELRDLLILTINRNTSTLDASKIDDSKGKSVIGVENKDTDELFFLDITEA